MSSIINPNQIVQKDFQSQRNGYNMDQVDAFLDALANSTGELFNMIQRLEAENKQLKQMVQNKDAEINNLKMIATIQSVDKFSSIDVKEMNARIFDLTMG